MPRVLEAGVLYVAEEFGAAAHLCACGCGSKVRTPLGPVDWSLEVTPSGPSLFPSIGNWQQPCRSHYWIRRGEVRWAESWSEGRVLAARENERRRAAAFFGENGDDTSVAWYARIAAWIRRLLRGQRRH